MLTLEKLDINNKIELSFIEKVYTESFPHSERRPFETMIKLYKDNPRFIVQIVKKAETSIGFLTFWEMNGFIFAEHFAIVSKARNEGIGGKIMQLFINQQTGPIILEVELPATILSERRIGFYQRLGFRLWENIPYQQPPYHEGENPIPMYLMSYGEIEIDKSFSDIKELLYSEVYNC